MQVYVHTAGGRPADQYIESILDYVVTRGANSVAFSFPLYTDGQRPTKVFAGEQTPPPAVLGRMAAAAHQRGLRVMLRPLLDEDSLRTAQGVGAARSSRPTWAGGSAVTRPPSRPT